MYNTCGIQVSGLKSSSFIIDELQCDGMFFVARTVIALRRHWKKSHHEIGESSTSSKFCKVNSLAIDIFKVLKQPTPSSNN